MKYKLRGCIFSLFGLFTLLLQGQVAVANDCNTVTDGLVACYHFEGNAQDGSGNGNDGTVYGEVSYTTGMVGNAASFNGVDSKILFHTIGSGHFTNNDFSVSFFLKLNSTDRMSVLSKRPSCSHGHFLDMRTPLGFEMDDGSNNYGYTNFTMSSTNQWQFVTMIKKGTNISTYVNGELDQQRTTNSIMDISNDAVLGISSSPCVNRDGTKSELDELGIYNRALSEVEIRQLYTVNHIPLSDVTYTNLPYLGAAHATDATGKPVTTSTVMQGGNAVNGQTSATEVKQKLFDTVDVMGDIIVDPVDVGQSVDIFVYAAATFPGLSAVSYYMLGPGLTILPWNQQPASLVAFSNGTLGVVQTVQMYSGTFFYPGTLKVYFGYRLPNGIVVTSNTPIDITIEQ